MIEKGQVICERCIFETGLGWMSLVTRGNVVCQLTMGHRTATAASRALRPEGAIAAQSGRPEGELVERLRSYADGRPEDFLDVAVDTSFQTPFGRAVLEQCRRIPYGETRTYGQLAAMVGRPQAARAVGGVMAANRTPLLIPCHRVVAADGRLGGFSAPGGVAFKRRLLDLELRGG
ncbi:MAG: MGMT family protein [Pirellulales bacterium]|nr:MGMT family protein [Pirellulales bacterium]